MRTSYIALSIFLSTGCSFISPPVQDCFKLVQNMDDFPKSGRCSAEGYIVEWREHYKIVPTGNSPHETGFSIGDLSVVWADNFESNVGKKVRISGRYSYLEGVLVDMAKVEEFEVIKAKE